jgi:hypothetical protein
MRKFFIPTIKYPQPLSEIATNTAVILTKF